MAVLLACAEYDTGSRQAADTIRQAALSLSVEADHAAIQGWRMRYVHGSTSPAAITAASSRPPARASKRPAPWRGGALAAQEARAWARIGDRRLLDGLPYAQRGPLPQRRYPAPATSRSTRRNAP